MTGYSISLDRLNSRIRDVNRLGNNVYWAIGNPGHTLNLTDSIRWVRELYPRETGYDQVVFWPDLKVYGRVEDIVTTLRNSGINQVGVGSLYSMTNGQIGCPPQILPLSEEVVLACSFNPLNPDHRQLLSLLLNIELPSKEQLQTRRQIGNELSMMPPGALAGFPGGQEYFQAQQRTAGRYGLGM